MQGKEDLQDILFSLNTSQAPKHLTKGEREWLGKLFNTGALMMISIAWGRIKSYAGFLPRRKFIGFCTHVMME